jgi:siderophore synthetase component
LEYEEIDAFDAYYDNVVINTCFMIVDIIKTCLKISESQLLMIRRYKMKEIEVSSYFIAMRSRNGH